VIKSLEIAFALLLARGPNSCFLYSFHASELANFVEEYPELVLGLSEFFFSVSNELFAIQGMGRFTFNLAYYLNSNWSYLNRLLPLGTAWII
jgi:hypothetical protein